MDEIKSLNTIYDSIDISDNVVIRIFSCDTNNNDLVWHTDSEDRILCNLNKSNWLIQLDNTIPCAITDNFLIPKNIYHRLIKGDGELQLKITKLS